MKNQNRLKKLMAIFLAVVFVALSIIAVVQATATEPFGDLEYSGSEIIGEDVELREESVKHYVCKDGSYVAAVYPEPVHYMENGEWKDIDTSLILSDEATYVTKASALQINIPQSLAYGQQLTMSNKGYTVGFGLSAANKLVSTESVAKLTDTEELASTLVLKDTLSKNDTALDVSGADKSEQEIIKEKNMEVTTLKNQSSAVVYDSVFPDADLEYIVTSTGIKENIVVNTAQLEYIYFFDFDTDDLVPVANEDGSIWLIERSKPNEPVFVLEAPFMYDANDEYSNNIKMTLENGVLTLEADAEWINDSNRAFPVVIDPTITVPVIDSAIMDTWVSSFWGNTNGTGLNSGKLFVGKTLIERNRTFVKFNLPTLSDDAIITNARFDIRKAATSLSDATMLIYDCYQIPSWNPGTITWNNQPVSKNANACQNQSNLPLLDSDEGATFGSTVYRFNVTEAVERWYAGGTNNGLLITTINENTIGQIDLFSSRHSTITNRPALMIDYYTSQGSPTAAQDALLIDYLSSMPGNYVDKKIIVSYLLPLIHSYDIGNLDNLADYLEGQGFSQELIEYDICDTYYNLEDGDFFISTAILNTMSVLVMLPGSGSLPYSGLEGAVANYFLSRANAFNSDLVDFNLPVWQSFSIRRNIMEAVAKCYMENPEVMLYSELLYINRERPVVNVSVEIYDENGDPGFGRVGSVSLQDEGFGNNIPDFTNLQNECRMGVPYIIEFTAAQGYVIEKASLSTWDEQLNSWEESYDFDILFHPTSDSYQWNFDEDTLISLTCVPPTRELTITVFDPYDLYEIGLPGDGLGSISPPAGDYKLGEELLLTFSSPLGYEIEWVSISVWNEENSEWNEPFYLEIPPQTTTFVEPWVITENIYVNMQCKPQ